MPARIPAAGKEGSSFFGMLTPVYEALAPAQQAGQELPRSPRRTRTHVLSFCSAPSPDIRSRLAPRQVKFGVNFPWPLQLWAARCCLDACGEVAGLTRTTAKGLLEKAAHLPWGKSNTSGDVDTSCPSFQGCRDVDISCPSICRKVNPASFIFSNTALSRMFWNSPISFAFSIYFKTCSIGLCWLLP